MHAVMVSGCINDWIGVDDTAVFDMSEYEKHEYAKQMFAALPQMDPAWFSQFLAWFLEEYGEVTYSEKPCECCGDITVTYELTLDD